MPDLTPEQQASLSALQRRLAKRAAEPAAQNNINNLGVYLLACEQQLIALMNNTPPSAVGNIEFGAVLYWIHNDLPDDEFFNWFASLFPAGKKRA